MAHKNILEKLAEVNPNAEIWWDSSPLVYRSWALGMVKKAPEGKREIWSEQLKRLFDPENPGETFFRGVTTNPPLSLNAIKDDPPFWATFVRELIRAHPEKGVEEIFWLTYKEVVKRGAQFYLPLWEKSNHKYGYLSGQVDPRYVFDAEKMFAQAMDLAQLSPNIMIKCPGSREGYDLIRRLTAQGIATNNTLAFTVPQFVECMEAVQDGLKIARENNVDLYRWRSVITHMSARYGTLGDLMTQAESRGIELSEADVRWAELAIFKRGYGILEEKGYPNKMLMCSMRISPPTDDGSVASWHIDKLAGGDVVYTCPPKYITELMEVEDRMRPFDSEAIHEPPPPKTLDKLLRIPYFAKSFEPDGMEPDEFNRHAALIATMADFSTATRGTVDFVAQQFQAEGKL
jgi:transaldolase